MSFRHIIAAGLVVGMAGLNAADAGGNKGRHRGGHRMGPRAEGGPPHVVLNLSEDQKAEAQALREQHRAAVEALHSSGEVTREDIRTLREQRRAAFEEILTDDQRAQLVELKAQRQAAREEHRSQRQATREEHQAERQAAREERAARLGLTDDQTTQLEALREQFRAQMEELRGSDGVTREAVHTLKQSRREAAQAILTEEQRALAAEFREARQAEVGHRRGGPGHRRFHRGFGSKPTDGDDPAGGEDGEESIIIDGDAAKASAATAVQSTTWGEIKSGKRQ